MLTMGMTGRMLTDYVGDGRLTRFGVRFTSQVFPGATLTATATVTAIHEANGEKIADFDIVTTDETGTRVLTGQAAARLED